jgi:hypothetical protein
MTTANLAAEDDAGKECNLPRRGAIVIVVIILDILLIFILIRLLCSQIKVGIF